MAYKVGLVPLYRQLYSIFISSLFNTLFFV
jgi:hypothetical protein